MPATDYNLEIVGRDVRPSRRAIESLARLIRSAPEVPRKPVPAYSPASSIAALMARRHAVRAA